MTELERLTEEFQRKYIAEKLAQCTLEQQALFTKIFPTMGKEKLLTAAGLIERTLSKNAKQSL